MRPLPDLPPDLGRAFSVGHAARLGVRRSVRDHPALERPFRGARLLRAGAPQSPGPFFDRERADALERMTALRAVVSPEAFFHGPSAAALWGIPLPAGLLRELHVAVVFPRQGIRRQGVRCTRMRSHLAQVVQGRRFRVLSAAATWASLAPFLDDRDLVAAADALLWTPRDPGGFHPERVRPPKAKREDLEAVLRRGKWAGAARLRRALERARDGAASRPETHVRLELEDAGLPEPELNQDIYEDEMWVACPDLKYQRYKVAVEYQSAHHFDAQQYEADLERRERLAKAGWLVVEVTAKQLYRTPELVVRRVQDALRSRGWSG